MSADNYNSKLPQFDMAYHLGTGYTPMSELMRAMILRTVEDYQSGGELRELAVAYMTCDDEEYVLSFRAICWQMGLNPDITREKIMGATKRISTRRRAA